MFKVIKSIKRPFFWNLKTWITWNHVKSLDFTWFLQPEWDRCKSPNPKKMGFRIGFGLFRIFGFGFDFGSEKSKIETRIQTWKSEIFKPKPNPKTRFFWVRTMDRCNYMDFKLEFFSEIFQKSAQLEIIGLGRVRYLSIINLN